MSQAEHEVLMQERQREALEILTRVMWHQHTSADLLYLASELGVKKEFQQDIAQRRAA